MKEQGTEILRQGNEPTAKSGELPGTLPASSSEKYLTVAHQKSMRKSNYLLMILFCIGLLILWFMIKKSTPQSAAASVAGDAQVETLLAKLAGVKSEMFSNLEEIAERFYRFSEVQQVLSEELVKNPFKIEAVMVSFVPPVNIKDTGYNSKTETVKQAEAEKYTGHMQLLSIMASDERRCCMIDDQILYEGDLVKGFKVEQIGENFVKLVQETPNDPNGGKSTAGTEVVLKLTE
jgi:hypothetical protein